MEEETKIPWTKKKSLALSGAILSLVLLLLSFVPMFTCIRDDKPFYGNLIDYFTYPSGNRVMAAVLLSLSALCMVVTIIRLIFSMRAHPHDGDKEDRNFVFGHYFFVLGAALYAVTFFSFASFVSAMVGLALTAYGIVIVIIHFRSLSEV